MTVTVQQTELSFLDRVAAVASWALACAIFLTIGWYAMEPDDPLGAVSALSRPGGVVMLLQAAALAGVAAAFATVLAGRRLADVGTFAVALGLGLVSLRGATSAHLLMQVSETSGMSEGGLALRFGLEAVGWFGVIAVTLCASALVMRWCYGVTSSRAADLGPHDSSSAEASRVSPRGLKPAAQVVAPPCASLAGFDIPQVSARWLNVQSDQCTAAAVGVRHTLVATGVGLMAMSAMSTGLSSRSIQHGQACFVVAASVFVATYVAYRMHPVRSALWPILSVGLLAILGYMWASVRPSVPSLPPYMPSSHFLRILPIQFIAVGTAAALATFWYMFIPYCGDCSGNENRKGP